VGVQWCRLEPGEQRWVLEPALPRASRHLPPCPQALAGLALRSTRHVRRVPPRQGALGKAPSCRDALHRAPFGDVEPVVATLVFAVVSLLFPITQLPRCFDGGGEGSSSSTMEEALVLPCVLSWSYLGCLTALALLAPSVWRFQRVRVQVQDARGLPQGMYQAKAVADMYDRYTCALGRVEVMRFVHKEVGRFNALEVFSYLEESNHRVSYK
jgi:hypothetical protein